jgi:hypothetical protein
MTTNSSNQPKHTPQQNGYNPLTIDDVTRPPHSPSQDYFGELRNPLARCISPLPSYSSSLCSATESLSLRP